MASESRSPHGITFKYQALITKVRNLMKSKNYRNEKQIIDTKPHLMTMAQS